MANRKSLNRQNQQTTLKHEMTFGLFQETSLSDSWTGFTNFILLKEEFTTGIYLSGERLTKVQPTTGPKTCKAAHKREKQEWANVKPKLENARRTRGISVRYTFIQMRKKLIQTHFHPKTLSSKNTFIQKHFHPKTLSSKTISSKTEDNFIHDTFIQKRFHPMTLSSKNGFVQ